MAGDRQVHHDANRHAAYHWHTIQTRFTQKKTAKAVKETKPIVEHTYLQAADQKGERHDLHKVSPTAQVRLKGDEKDHS